MRRLSCLLFFCCFLFAANSFAATLKQVRVWQSPDSTRLVLDLSSAIKYQIFRLNKPERVVIDLQKSQANKTFKASLKQAKSASGLFKNIRTGTRNGTDTRIVIDLTQPVQAKSFTLKPTRQYGHRLVIDLITNIAKPKSIPISNKRSKDIIIAVDPGHGGEDPGASGGRGIHEKNIVLNIARYLVTLLKAEPGFKPVMTRSSDYYVSLRGRTAIARKNHADFFVSIHADAFTNTSARGSSVFALSERGASSETGRWLAKTENSVDLIGGVGSVSLDDKDKMLAGVLLDLSMTSTLNSSLKIGSNVLGSIKPLNKLHKGRVEQAAFVVLKSPDIPSILVETGFITNSKDRAKLTQRAYQKRMAHAIFTGIVTYFRNRPPPGTWLASYESKSYKIKNGDTLSEIASRYGVTLQQLRKVNKLKNNRIHIGQILVIP